MTSERKAKLRAGNLRIPVLVRDTGTRLEFEFGYNPNLLAEIKAMDGAKWHGFEEEPRKVWSIPKSRRNLFQLDYMEGKDPYARYDASVLPFTAIRPSAYLHQCAISGHVLTRRQCIVAAEMGTGKTLSLIEVMEQSGSQDWWWVAPKAALKAVELEFWKWRTRFTPRFLTYENLVKVINQWEPGAKAPFGVVFDESSRLKSPNAQRSTAAMRLADGIRSDYGDSGFVVLMSGSPAPKSPLDWWMQCEIACPGFLREGNIHKFKARLAITRDAESVTGGRFPQLVAWRDSDFRCEECGQFEDDEYHNLATITEEDLEAGFHRFKRGTNEVQKLYGRMKGLVHIVFKKDCLDLPEKQYRVIKCDPNPEVIRAAQLIAAVHTSAAQALIMMRELSDGFQYREVEVSREDCVCKDGEDCAKCFGSKIIKKVSRETIQVPCPKDEVLEEVLEDHEDARRLVTFAGFTGSIDRVVRITAKAGWEWIRVDGRGWASSWGETDPVSLLKTFAEVDNDIRKINFIAHPGSGGMGLTLTASPSILYFSNDFNAESRIQSEDRIHRPGCRGANIIDIEHLPSDRLVLDNLRRKRDLQAMTLGELVNAMNDNSERTT